MKGAWDIAVKFHCSKCWIYPILTCSIFIWDHPYYRLKFWGNTYQTNKNYVSSYYLKYQRKLLHISLKLSKQSIIPLACFFCSCVSSLLPLYPSLFPLRLILIHHYSRGFRISAAQSSVLINLYVVFYELLISQVSLWHSVVNTGRSVYVWGEVEAGGQTGQIEGEKGKINTTRTVWKKEGIYWGGMMIYVRGVRAVRVRWWRRCAPIMINAFLQPGDNPANILSAYPTHHPHSSPSQHSPTSLQKNFESFHYF